MTYYIGTRLREFFNVDHHDDIDYYKDPRVKKIIFTLLEKANYKQTDLQKAIDTRNHEIMINCDSYYLLSLNNKITLYGYYTYDDLVHMLKGTN